MRYAVHSIILMVAMIAQVSAVTLEVCENCEFSSISDAIKASADGDTVVVKSGVYRENVLVNKSISIIGDNAVIEPRFVLLPAVSANGVRDFFFKGMEVRNSTLGLEAMYIGNLTIKDCNFSNNVEGIKLFEVGQGRLEGLTLSGFYRGIVIESSRFVELEDSRFDGILAIAVDYSSKISLSNLNIKAQKGVELMGGEDNLIQDSTFEGDTFIHAMSESRLVVGKNDVEGIYAVDEASIGSTYVFDGVNVTGENFQISLAELKLPDDFIQYGSIVNVTINPSIYTGDGSVYFELNDEGKIGDAEKATLAIYRFDGDELNQVSDYYNSTNYVPLSYDSNNSGVYVLAAVESSTPSIPVKPTPGFEVLAALIAIAVIVAMRRKG